MFVGSNTRIQIEPAEPFESIESHSHLNQIKERRHGGAGQVFTSSSVPICVRVLHCGRERRRDDELYVYYTYIKMHE